jgi:hypothetical protein
VTVLATMYVIHRPLVLMMLLMMLLVMVPILDLPPLLVTDAQLPH